MMKLKLVSTYMGDTKSDLPGLQTALEVEILEQVSRRRTLNRTWACTNFIF